MASEKIYNSMTLAIKKSLEINLIEDIIIRNKNS